MSSWRDFAGHRVLVARLNRDVYDWRWFCQFIPVANRHVKIKLRCASYRPCTKAVFCVPTEALALEEHQLVSVIVLDEEPGGEEIEFEPAPHFEALADRSIDRDTVRLALSKIPGSLDADFAAERDEG